MTSFEDYCTKLSEAERVGDQTRLLQGEIATLIVQEYGHGGLKHAALESAVEYKTLAERSRVVDFYGSSDEGEIAEGRSKARDLLDELGDGVRWTHLRDAKGLGQDLPDEERRELAIMALLQKADRTMTSAQWYKYLAELRGKPPSKYVINDYARGWRITIQRIKK